MSLGADDQSGHHRCWYLRYAAHQTISRANAGTNAGTKTLFPLSSETRTDDTSKTLLVLVYEHNYSWFTAPLVNSRRHENPCGHQFERL